MALEINGERIEDDIIQEEFAHIKRTYQTASQSTDRTATGEPSPQLAPLPDDATLLVWVKENITRKTLLRQEALKANIVISETELAAALQSFLADSQSHSQANNPPLNFQTLTSQEQTSLKNHVELNLKITALLEKVSSDINPVEPRHIKTFYETNLDHYQKPDRIHLYYLAHVPTASASTTPTVSPKATSPVSTEARLAPLKLTALKEALATCTAAAKLKAFRHSPTHPAPKEIRYLFNKHCLGLTLLTGDLGQRELTALDPAITRAVATLPINEISSPVFIADTIYLFYVLALYPAGIPPLAEIADEVEADLIREIKERKQDIYVAKLMKASTLIDYEYL